MALYPIAVALVKLPVETSEEYPSAVFKVPVVFEESVKEPANEGEFDATVSAAMVAAGSAHAKDHRPVPALVPDHAPGLGRGCEAPGDPNVSGRPAIAEADDLRPRRHDRRGGRR